ncbi:hypothetical protein V8B55DRAFT_1105717 [Mucor lusitanicus]|uniref:NADH:flavin oxidoreductase/NADH oxidase N-terminal domain-containing protein n=2 Tax=Mucor circinelloides f. lusitanicus TaxID=29924 RepID=A0A168GLC9_MUCCL|nr:hypothetical protein FB192DRAFT_1324664 [Mucor lusitanicus]OAC97807.1 hypothetical protein MUCCIDRAFT_150867 [Mucor lusitanicus CBS 277.49]
MSPTKQEPATQLPPQVVNAKPAVGATLAQEDAQVSKLLSPSTIRSVTLNNRIVVSPMCMYSSQDGFFNDFHVAHYGQFAIKGAGMVIIEATAVEPRGRITPEDAGLWSDDHIPQLAKIVSLIKSQGSVPAIQIAHAGRRASVYSPFHCAERLVSEEFGGWPTDIFGPTGEQYSEGYGIPKQMTEQDMEQVIQHFADAAVRADKAGIEVLEIHSAHGFLLHSFLSGNSNQRTDRFGGSSLENRLRFPLAVVERVRAAWPAHKPLWVRLSASDHKSTDGTLVGGEDADGWDIRHATLYAKKLKEMGVDVIDVSSGGNVSKAHYSAGPLYQVPFSEYIKKEAGVATGAVGIITEPKDAEDVLQHDQADYILIARELLRDSGWVNRASKELQIEVKWPKQYLRANRERYLKTVSANKKY